MGLRNVMALMLVPALLMAGASPVIAGPNAADAEQQAGSGSPPPPPAATPVAVFGMRASVVPRPADVEVLKAGQSLMLASSSGGMTIVEYGVKDGKITYAVTSGAISDKDRKAIEKAIAKMQKQFDN